MILAVGLYERAAITADQAAVLAGISKREFIETAGRYGVSDFDQTTIEEILQDAEVVEKAVDWDAVNRRLAARAQKNG